MSHGRKGMKVSSGTATTTHMPNFLADYSAGRILPPVQIVSEISDGIIVSALSVPLQRTATTARKNQDFKSGNRSVLVKEAVNVTTVTTDNISLPIVRSEPNTEVRNTTTANDTTQNRMALEEINRRLEDATASEKALKKKVVALEKTIDDQQKDMKDKDMISNELRSELSAAITLEAKYKELYEAECTAHANTQSQLSSVRAAIKEKEREFVLERQQHIEEIEELRRQADKMLADLRDVKDKEIAIRDEKVKKMKAQMAEAFAGNSWERQLQLDSLTKELTKAQDEADALRHKLKTSYDKAPMAQSGQSSTTSCDNCQQLAGRLERKDKTLREKERGLEEATALCSALRKQLRDKDEQLKQWTSMQGRVLIFPK